MAFKEYIARFIDKIDVTIGSGHTIDFESGSTWKIAGSTVTASAADLNSIGGSISTTNSATFTLDNDSTTGKFVLTNVPGGTNHSVILQTTAPSGGDITLTLPASTGTIALTTDTSVDIDAGADGTAGSLDIFPTTASNGKLIFTATDMGGAWNMAITNDAIAAARSYKIPDAGGDGKFVMTTAANAVLINANSSDRSVSLSGDVTLAGDLTTGGAVTFSGAFDAQINVPSASTWTLPSGGGTLATTTGSETGTTSSVFTVDNDSSNAKIALDTNSATGNFTASLVPANLTANRTITFQDATDTVVGRDTTDTLTNKTLTTPEINGVSTAAAANNFDLSSGTGTFKTPQGIFTHYGNVTHNGNITFDFSSSNGTFKTSTGTNTIGGDMVVADGKQIDIGSAAGGDATPLRIFSATAANGILVIKCQDDANNNTTTLQSGDPGAGINPTITLPIADCTLPGLGIANTWTSTNDFKGNLSASASNPNVDWSGSSGTFDTTTGTCQINGAGGVTINGATTPAVVCASGKTNTGYLKVNGKTSGSLILTTADATAQDTTVTLAAQTGGGAVALGIPDVADTSASFVMTKGTNTCTGTYNFNSATVQNVTPTGTLDISGATVTYRSILNADIGAGAAIVRSKLAEEALAKYGIPFSMLRNDDGTVVDATGGAGLFSITNGGIGTGTQTLDGEAASGNSKTDVVQFEFTMPPEYVSAGDVRVILTAKESVGAATVSTTLSGEAYEDDNQGGVGSNVLASWDQTDITDSWQTFTGTITSTSLTAGDKVRVYIQVVTNDTGGAVGTVTQIGKVEMQADIKG